MGWWMAMIDKNSRPLLLRAWFALALLAVAGCGGVAREPTDPPDGGGTPGADGAMPEPDAGEPVDVGSSRGCGGMTAKTCLAGEYCFYSVAQACGAADATGVCVPRAMGCPAIYMPVCGCDDKTHGNSCEAAMHGVSVASEGACAREDAALCRDGETKKVECNTCTCHGGHWGCTIIACPPP
jgi:hypothetical protein